jgi:glycosyltransferase involved in cell wall biosynthesis
MKILMVLESKFPPDKRVEKEMIALSEVGHEISLACSGREGHTEENKWGKSVIFRKRMSTVIYKSSVGCLKFPFYFNFWKKHIFNLLDKNKFDVIHIHDLPLIKTGAEAKEKYGIKLVIDLHENYPALLKDAVHTKTLAGRLLSSNSEWRAYERRYLPEADLVISVVEEAAERIANLGINKDKICIVSNTFDIEADTVENSDAGSGEFTLFYGGAINRHRGLQVVFRAINILREKKLKVNLMIVGSGSYLNQLKELAAGLELQSYITFFGYQPFNEMLRLLSIADAGIIPHLRTDNNDASSPNKLYQYMYLKKPVISSDCISLKRIINETGAGSVYNSDSPSDLALVLQDLITNRPRLKEMGENGRKAVISKYNWNSDKSRLIASYSKLVQDS